MSQVWPLATEAKSWNLRSLLEEGWTAWADRDADDPNRTCHDAVRCVASLCRRHVARPALPRPAHGAGAGIGLRVCGELAVEFADQRDAIGELELGAGGGERG